MIRIRRTTSTRTRLTTRAALAMLVVALAATTAAGVTFAAFSGIGTNSGNSFSAAALSPPGGLTATQTCRATSTIAFKDAASATGTGGLLTIAKPGNVSAGDVMLAQFAIRAHNSTITAPAGWTAIRGETLSGGIQSVLYSKVATASEPTSYTWTSSASARTGGGIAAYSGVDASTPVDVHAGSTGFSATPTAPSVTTNVANTVLAVFFVARQQVLTSLPSGMTGRWNLDTAGGAGSIGVGAADQPFAGPGATGTRSATTGSSFDWIGQSVALRPKAAPYAALSWTATPSEFATGYKLQRWVGTVQEREQTVTPRTQTSTTDGPLTPGTSYSFTLSAYYSNWTSNQVTATLNAASC